MKDALTLCIGNKLLMFTGCLDFRTQAQAVDIHRYIHTSTYVLIRTRNEMDNIIY